MPRKIQPKLLEKLAMECICQNFLKIFYVGDNDEDERSSGANLWAKSPINDLPSQILEDLASEMKRIKNIKDYHLNILLTEHIKKWNGSGVGGRHVAFVTARCKKLRHLNMSFVPESNQKLWMKMIPTLSNIVVLNLQINTIEDQVLNQIGAHCNNLLDLNVSHTLVTDKGLVRLCLSSRGERRSQKLVRLSVRGNSISKNGAAVVIKFLPNLRIFDYEHIVQAVKRAGQLNLRAELRLFKRAGVRVTLSKATCLSLTHFSANSEFVTEMSLKAAGSLCPDVTEL